MKYAKIILASILFYGNFCNSFLTSQITHRVSHRYHSGLTLYSKKNNTDISKIFHKYIKKIDKKYDDDNSLYSQRYIFGLSEYDIYVSQLIIYFLMCYYLYIYIAIGIAKLYGL